MENYELIKNMKKNKTLKKLVEKCVGSCCKEGRINRTKALKVIKGLKSLPLEEAVYSISEFLKELKKQKNKHLLTIESAVPLSKTDVDKISRKFSKEFKVSEVNNITNPNLFGGLKIRVGDIVFDDSIKNRIKELGGIIHG